jgi:hypothetical protein
MKSHKRFKWLLLIAVILAVALPLIGVGCADRLILPPVPKNVRHDGSPRVAIPFHGGALEGFTARSPGATTTQPAAYVLRFSGDAAGAAKFTAGRWQNKPIEAWAVNYPGYGGSVDPRTLKALAEASLGAFDALRATAGTRPIFVEGFSLATVPALYIAAHRDVAGVILQNPPPLRQLILGRNGWWNLWLLAGPVPASVPKEFDSIANASNSKCPAVFLMAERDNTVPMPYQQRIAAAYAGLTRIIVQANADHADPLNPADEAKLHGAMDWLWSQSAKH